MRRLLKLELVEPEIKHVCSRLDYIGHRISMGIEPSTQLVNNVYPVGGLGGGERQRHTAVERRCDIPNHE